MKIQRTPLLLALAAALVAVPACKFIAGQLVAFVDRYENGTPKREGTLVNGLQSGDWVYYYEDGRRRAKGRYEDDHQVGPWTYWYEGGTVEWQGRFDEDGLRSGAWKFYYPSEALRAQGSFADDFEEGYWRFFSQGGALEREGSFDAGKLSGVWTYFNGDGSRKAQGVCHRGQRIGPWTLWDEGGSASIKEYPIPTGLQIVREQWPDETLKRVGVLDNGDAVGRWVSYHESGALRFACSFRDGKPAGLFEARREDGSVLALGRLDGNELAEGCLAFVNGEERAMVPGPMPQRPPASGEWSRADIVETMPAEAVVATWLQEARIPVEPEALVAAAPSELPAAAPALVAEVESAPTRLPAAVQPSWTVLQQQELDDYVMNYLEGPSKKRMSRRSYGPAGSRGGASGPGRRESLENRPLPIKRFEAVDGTVVNVDDLKGKKRILLVVLRGFVGEVCVYCVAQTEALAQCKDDFDALGIEVLVVYPGPEENQEAFQQAYEQTFGRGAPPYKVFYDQDLELVTKLGIAGDLAYPSTFIIDKQGMVEYAFVGAHRADRPAAKKLLELIRGMKQ